MSESQVMSRAGLVRYPVPLRGIEAVLMLPSDLTAADVRRLVAMLETLVLPEPSAHLASPREGCTGLFSDARDCPVHRPQASLETVKTAERLAQEFHEAYERLAPSFGYETREASRKPWHEVPEQNRRLMTAVCAEVMGKPSALASPREGPPFIDTPLLQAKRLAFDDPTQANLDALIAAAKAEVEAQLKSAYEWSDYVEARERKKDELRRKIASQRDEAEDKLADAHRRLLEAAQSLEAQQANEGLALMRLSDALTGGAAGTWDEVFHAAEGDANA